MLVAFVPASTPPFDLAFNKVAAAVTGGAYCHCETAFEGLALGRLRAVCDTLNLAHALPESMQRARDAARALLAVFPPRTPDDEPVTLAFHALAGQPLGVRVLSPHAEDVLNRPYDDTWRVYRLPDAPRKAVQAQLVWSLSQVGKPYDTMGALTSPLHSGHAGAVRAPDPSHWFCSNLSLRFLQHLNLCSGLSLTGTTPNSLERALRQYIPADAARLEADTGGAATLQFDAEHWGLVGSIAPYIVRADLGVK